MIIYAVYIVSDSGPLVSETFHTTGKITDEVLLSGLFVALGIIAEETTQSEMKVMEVEGLSFHFRSFGMYQVVLVTDVPQSPDNLIQKLGLRFMKEHGERLLDRIIHPNQYSPFKKIIHEIIRADSTPGDAISELPDKKINTGEIFCLPHHLQATILAVVTLKEGTIEEIAKESDLSLDETSNNLANLKDLGYIGTKQQNGLTYYFCSY